MDNVKHRKEQTRPQPLRLTISQSEIIEHEAEELQISKAKLLQWIIEKHITRRKYENRNQK
jgi:hypothetical protein